MQRTSYTGDGLTTEFYFNFPYYENTDIVVTKNTQTATGYTIVGTSAGENADIPYNGGKVVFDTAPTALDSITISRKLPLTRVVDYQPSELINPTLLNQDINYTIEVLKDFQDELECFKTKYNDIVNNISTQTLLEHIATVTQQITALGDISTIRDDITNLKGGSNFTNAGKSAIVGFGVPDYSNGSNIFAAARTTGYTAPTNGFISVCQTPASSAYNITIDNQIVASKDTTQASYSGCFFGFVAQGSVIKTTIPENAAGLFLFFPTR